MAGVAEGDFVGVLLDPGLVDQPGDFVFSDKRQTLVIVEVALLDVDSARNCPRDARNTTLDLPEY